MSAIPEKTALSDAIAPMLSGSISTDDETICDSLNHKFQTDPELLISRLSFTHIREIMSINDPLERFFYEFECIRGTWSVRELRRQIGTNLYFRAGISKKPELLFEKIQTGEPSAMLAVREPVALDFLGLDDRLSIEESDLEQALMDHLQEFLLEMGKGFCFEARQKRIIIDDEYFYPDLVLYNRILHCSVIVELKNEPFSHQHLGQLNAYVAYYKENEMHFGDNPPVGILLCTKRAPKWSNMPFRAWISSCLYQPICFSCRIKSSRKRSCWNRWKKWEYRLFKEYNCLRSSRDNSTYCSHYQRKRKRSVYRIRNERNPSDTAERAARIDFSGCESSGRMTCAAPKNPLRFFPKSFILWSG